MLYHSLLDNGVIDDLKAKAASLNGISASTSEGTEYIRSNKSWYPYRRYNDWMFDLNSKIDTVKPLTTMFDTFSKNYVYINSDSYYYGANFYRFKNRNNMYFTSCFKFSTGKTGRTIDDGYIYSYNLVDFYYVQMVQGTSSYPYERTQHTLYSDDHDKILIIRSYGKQLYHYYIGSFLSNETMQWTRYQNSSYTSNPEGGIYSKTIQKFILSLDATDGTYKRINLYLIDPTNGNLETVNNGTLKSIRGFFENKEHTKIYGYNTSDTDIYESSDGRTWSKSTAVTLPYQILRAYYVEREDLYVFFTKDLPTPAADRKQYVYTSKDLVTFEKSCVYFERNSTDNQYNVISNFSKSITYIDHLNMYVILDKGNNLSGGMRYYYSFDGCKTWKYGNFILKHNLTIDNMIYDEYRKQLVICTNYGIELLPFV